METSPTDDKQISIIEILSTSWNLYKSNFLLFVGIYALGNAFYLISEIRNLFFGDVFDWIEFLLFTLGIVSSFWAAAALYIAAFGRLQGQPISFKNAFNQVKGRFWRYAGYSILYLLISVMGLFLLIIPGIYWGTKYILVDIITIVEDKSKDPLKISDDLVTGSFWKVFFVSAISLVIFTIPFLTYWGWFGNHNIGILNLLNEVTSIFFGAFYTIVGVVLYYKLTIIKST